MDNHKIVIYQQMLTLPESDLEGKYKAGIEKLISELKEMISKDLKEIPHKAYTEEEDKSAFNKLYKMAALKLSQGVFGILDLNKKPEDVTNDDFAGKKYESILAETTKLFAEWKSPSEIVLELKKKEEEKKQKKELAEKAKAVVAEKEAAVKAAKKTTDADAIAKAEEELKKAQAASNKAQTEALKVA